MLIRVLSCLALSLSVAPADTLPAVGKVAPNAQGLWLVEVAKAESYDERGGDGNLGLRVKLRPVKGTGKFVDTLHIVTEYGGLQQPGTPPAKPPTFLKPSTFQLKKQYWIAFASLYQRERHPQGVVGYWKKGDPKVEDLFGAAVKEDVLDWSPIYDPRTEITYGRRAVATAEGTEPAWQLRLEREGKELWKKTIPGVMCDRYRSWVIDHYARTNYPDLVQESGVLLLAETLTTLPKDNEFGLPAGKVYLRTIYDPDTGKRLCTRIRASRPGHPTLLERKYDFKTGKVRGK